MFKAVAFSALVATGLAAPVTEVKSQAAFVDFMKTYNKEYPSSEVFARYNTFKANVAKIEAHNAGDATWTMAVNEFADMTADEFKVAYYGYKHRDAGVHRAQLISAFVSNLPTFATPRKRPASSPLMLQVFASCRAHWSCALRASSSVLPEKEFLRLRRPIAAPAAAAWGCLSFCSDLLVCLSER